jgi:uncharacterized protein (DUF1800 family)
MASDVAQVIHLLRRSGFGGPHPEAAGLAALDLPAVVDRVLDFSLNPPAVKPAILDDPNADWYPTQVALTQFWFDRMATVPSPLQEKLALFWHGHLATSQSKVDLWTGMYEQNALFRSAGGGSFLDLVQQMSLQPAMLIWLDNGSNVAGAPNENFARELMELFTLSVNQYTQDDVVASARAWTGHVINRWDDPVYVFKPDKHDNGDKTFFGVTKNWDGPDIVTEILTGQKKDIAARFIATKLWSFFAYPNPPAQLVQELADAYLAGGLDIRNLLRTVFLRPEFYSVQATQGLVTSPTEFIVAVMRSTGLTAADIHPEWWGTDMGQELFFPPDVSGWRQNGYWVSTSASWARTRCAEYAMWTANNKKLVPNRRALSVTDAVQAAFDEFGVPSPSAATRGALEGWLTGERAANGWGQDVYLYFLTMVTPDFQLA